MTLHTLAPAASPPPAPETTADPSRPIPGASSPPRAPETLQERLRWRFRFLIVALVAAAVIVVVRLVTYQVVEWGMALPVGTGHHGPPARGTIVDRNGLLLAADRYTYSIAANTARIDEEEERALAGLLEEIIGLPANRTLALISQFPDAAYLELGKSVPLEQAQRIPALQEQWSEEESPLHAVFITPMPKRYYPQRTLAGHAIGFVNLERKPFYGLESYYDRFLVENSGITFTDTPRSTLDQLAPEVRRLLPSLANKDLILTIDSSVQWIVEEELAQGLKEYKAERGTIIVMEPHTGQILGMASLPGYDPNRYGDAQYEQFLDPAISQQYEPGSVFKIVTMGAALDTGVITPSTTYNDTGLFSVGGRPIFNSQLIGYGEVTAEFALVRSLNVVTAMIAVETGSSRFYDYVRRFGFGSATQIDLAGEIPGALKTPGDPDWSESDLGTNSFGQGLATTPLQMLNATASIANGGKLMRPYVVMARVHDGQVQETEPTVIHSTISPAHAAELTGMMVSTVAEGTKAALVEGYSVAGKSGTAQIPDPEGGGYLADQVNASFVGFLPAQEPRLAILVRLEKPDQAVTLWASDNAAPLFARVARRLVDTLNIPPDEYRQSVAQTGGQ